MSGQTKQIPTYINVPAGSDLSTKQNYFAALSSGAAAVAGAGAAIIGVIDNDPDAAGAATKIQNGGIALVLAGGTCTRDLGAASDASGKAVNAAGSARTVGVFLDTGSSGDLVRVLLGLTATAQAADVEAVSASGALNPEVPTTDLSVSGTKAYTLAAPTHIGQKKTVRCVAAAATPAGTLTVSSPDDTAGFVCPATFFFDNSGQTLVFEATSALKWRCTKKVRAGVKALVIGTTVTTGICDMSHVDVAVTGTVASTTTKALPNGAAVGELCSITCSTAATTPHGDLGGTFATKAGAATGTLLDDFTLVTDNALLEWNGSAWKPLILAGTTLSIA